MTGPKIQQQAAVEFSPVAIAKPSQKPHFTLSWTHYVLLLTVKDPDERRFYKIEATSEGWSVPELKCQKASCLYERLALSRDKAGIKRLICPARTLPRRVPPEWRQPLADERLLILSGFGAGEKRVTAELAVRRNEFVAALGD